MYTASLSALKKELKSQSYEELLATCFRLARYKKENKELLHYLLLESHDEEAYIAQIKEDISEGLSTVNASNLYFAKKGIRRVLKVAGKQIKFSGEKKTEVEVLLFFCQQVIDLNLGIENSKVMVNLINSQVKKIEKALSTLHEDLQYDYSDALNEVSDWTEKHIFY